MDGPWVSKLENLSSLSLSCRSYAYKRQLKKQEATRALAVVWRAWCWCLVLGMGHRVGLLFHKKKKIILKTPQGLLWGTGNHKRFRKWRGSTKREAKQKTMWRSNFYFKKATQCECTGPHTNKQNNRAPRAKDSGLRGYPRYFDYHVDCRPSRDSRSVIDLRP